MPGVDFRGERPVQELLPWVFKVSDQVVACKDSGLMAVFEIGGVDANTITAIDSTVLLERVHGACQSLMSRRAALWWTVHRRESTDYPESERWGNEIARAVDDAHRESFLNSANFINRHYVTVVSYPETGANSFFAQVSEFVNDGMSLWVAVYKAASILFSSENAFAYSEEQLVNAVTSFETGLEKFSNGMAGARVERLSGDALTGFLSSCASPEWDGSPVKTKKGRATQWFLDSLLGNHSLEVYQNAISFNGGPAGEFFAGAVSVKEWPEYTNAGEMDLLLSMPFEMTVSHVFRFAGTAETSKQIESTKRFNSLLKHSIKSWIMGAFSQGAAGSANPAREAAEQQCDYVIGELTSGHISFGWQNSTVVAYARTEEDLSQNISALFGLFNGIGYPGVIRESLHLLSAWASTLPGQWRECRRWTFLSSDNMVDSAPVRTILQGSRENKHLSEQLGRHVPALTMLKTDYLTPFYFNFHYGALGHTLVLGPSRSGKSVAMNFLISQWQKYTPCRTLIFDKDRSCRIATLLQGGSHIDFSESNNGIKINPLALVRDPKSRGFLIRWIEILITSKGYVTKAADEQAISEALAEVAANNNPEHHRLRSVWTQLPGHLKLELEAWVGDGALAHYFDNVEDNFSLDGFTCVEMGFILREKRVARAFMDYAFYRIQQMMEKNREVEVLPTFIYLEECWFLLEDPYFAERIRDWLKTMAKMTCHVVMATQSLEDIALADSRVFSSMRDNIMTNIYLPNAKANTSALKQLYRKEFELTDEQISLVANATPQSEYFIVTPNTARMVSCHFDKFQLAVLRSDDKAQGVFNRHYSSGRSDWKERYFKELLGDELYD